MSDAAEEREDAAGAADAAGASRPARDHRRRARPRLVPRLASVRTHGPCALSTVPGALAALSVMSVGLVHFSPAPAATAVAAADASAGRSAPDRGSPRHPVHPPEAGPGGTAGSQGHHPQGTGAAGRRHPRCRACSKAARRRRHAPVGAPMNPVPLDAAMRSEPSRRRTPMDRVPRCSEDPSPDADATWSGPSMGGRLDVRIAVLAGHPAARRQDGGESGRARHGVGVPIDAFHAYVGPRATQRRAERSVHAGPAHPGGGPRMGRAGRRGRRVASLDVTLLDARLAAERPATDVLSPGRLGPHSTPATTELGPIGTERPLVGRSSARPAPASTWTAWPRAGSPTERPPCCITGRVPSSTPTATSRCTSGPAWSGSSGWPIRASPKAELLATFSFVGDRPWRRSFGVATSGTSVHRWHACRRSSRRIT